MINPKNDTGHALKVGRDLDRHSAVERQQALDTLNSYINRFHVPGSWAHRGIAKALRDSLA